MPLKEETITYRTLKFIIRRIREQINEYLLHTRRFEFTEQEIYRIEQFKKECDEFYSTYHKRKEIHLSSLK